MFVSHPQHEFSLPMGLDNQGSKHWRLVEFSLHTPWFLLTVSEYTEEREILLTHTWCIAWERDLAQILDTIDVDDVQGLVCMMPGWLSAHGEWTSREIREVWWMRTDDAGEFMRFLDVEGKEFDGGLRSEIATKIVERRQLLKVGARYSHA